ncbi:putative short-chain dehydrogenase [Aspergillus clavatus NRRL 1]|uniref:Short-chain dehydrogenase, putative n=1 Tax=Aspergillus clavatus (strain ATCC 1007 / CBS 513.65 / DSM 816 / NCTC 3887 / NRRL 1 / QM 1276 / 107) TaxID=344612 RepID=A1CNW7_ASPCL|nr:short-chain dehydrogenase, putative [Aspergillus clavatus NRRL 1]EAW07338.1 short-chain dehydrogenase, putative [Aspergillus clavatus NRRL 1]
MPAPYNTNTVADELVADYAPQIKDKVVLTTGISSGTLGGFFVQSIAKAEPALLILAARSAEKLAQTAAEITTAHPAVQVRTLQVDLGSLQSVRAAAAQVNSWQDVPVIDVLVNNAGIMAVDFKLSPDGFESQLATNHLGPFLFTNLIMEKIVAAKEPRVVVVSSFGHRLNPIRFDDYNFDDGKTYNSWYAYGQSKTANMLFAISLAQKLAMKHNLQAFSVHPGVIWTNLANHLDLSVAFDGLGALDKSLGNREGWQEFDVKPLERGAATHIYAAFDPCLKANNGAYLLDCHVADPLVDTVKPWATSSFEAERLWRLSEKLVGQEFSY